MPFTILFVLTASLLAGLALIGVVRAIYRHSLVKSLGYTGTMFIALSALSAVARYVPFGSFKQSPVPVVNDFVNGPVADFVKGVGTVSPWLLEGMTYVGLGLLMVAVATRFIELFAFGGESIDSYFERQLRIMKLEYAKQDEFDQFARHQFDAANRRFAYSKARMDSGDGWTTTGGM